MSHAAHAQLIATLASLSSTLADFPPPTSSSNANSTTWPTNPAAVLAIDTDLGALVDLTATAGDAVLADALVGRGGAELVLKIVAEASVGDGAGEADALERIREMGMACLANLVRSPALAPTLVSSSLCAEVVAFMLVSEAEPRILLATIRFLQSAVTVVPPPQLVPLVSALLDAGDAGALAHLVFVLGATLHLPLFVATVNLFTALVWLVHRRLAIATPPGSSDPEFPVVGRATVEEGVRALVRAATADHEPGRGLDLDWAGAAAVTKCLGTLAMVGYGWRQIVDAHADVLYRLCLGIWPSVARDPDLEPLAGYLVRLLSLLDRRGWVPFVAALSSDVVSTDRLVELCVLHQQYDLLAPVVPRASQALVRRLKTEVPDALDALKDASPVVWSALVMQGG